MSATLIRLLAHRFVSFQQVAGGSTSTHSYCFLSEKWAAIQTARCESESYSGEEIKGLTAKVFGGDFDLVQTNWSFSENCEPILQTPKALPMWISPQTARQSQEVQI